MTQNKTHMGQKVKNRISNGAVYIVLVIISIIWLIPFVFIVIESFRCESSGPENYLFPHKWGFDNYIYIFNNAEYWTWFWNTFIIGLACSVIQTIMVLSVSYALSRLRFKGRKKLMNFMLIIGMFPGFLAMILLYRLLSDMGLTKSNSVWGLILVYCASSGMGYYVSKGFFDTISKSLDEAARIDGATRFQVFYKIILPLSKPIIIYTVLSAFMGPWGDFMFASYVSHGSSAGTNIAVGLRSWITEAGMIGQKYTMFCAGGVIVAIPITILFMLLQRYYVEGVTGGAVKG